MEPKPRNDPQNAVTKFCLAMEELRRTDGGRVKNAKDFVDYFFPYDESRATDQLFAHLPREVRAPVVAGWGIRGAKAALRDDDERIRSVVHDAILAGDIDAGVFEEGVTASIVTSWVPLGEWWFFWRSGKVSGVPAQKALATARELGLFDDRWFLENLEGRGGRLKGTDTIADTLSKEQIVAWVRGLHASGDGSPAGLVAALGWETILTKTAQEALLFALDALAKKIGLAKVALPEVRGSEVPGIAIPDFPMEEKGSEPEEPVNLEDAVPVQADSLVPFSGGGDSASEWPEFAAPGDMGYALAQPSMKPDGIKPSYGDDDEITQAVPKGGPAAK
ncbi:hypothetical protein BH11MYX4_BH11MYX4_63620 [soil metagenome]